MSKPVQFVLEDSQISDLQRAFPELPDADAYVQEFALFAVTELIDLLAGRKRYLSLSHQYIEWLEQLNARLLPDVEFTPRRLMNQFNFPPGTASYISRVLRDRQNVQLMTRAWTTLLSRFKETKARHDGLKPAERGEPGRLWSITLTKREYYQLQLLLEELEAGELKKDLKDRQVINLPEISENRLDFVKIQYTITEIERVIEALRRRVPVTKGAKGG